CKYAGEAAPQVHVWHEVDASAGIDRLYFKDQGIGIPEGARERVFESFTRLHHAKDVEGTGIGLAICRRIAEAHGGTLTIDPGSESGACFVLALPQSEVPARPLPS
ncbi:MAG: ATP-binding protein, partial [Pseudomonadota bacterium]